MGFYRSVKQSIAQDYGYTMDNVIQSGIAPSLKCVFNNYNLITSNNFIIGDQVIYSANMFEDCSNFNGNVKIGNNVINASYMFANCTNFNTWINGGSNLINCSHMFENCTNFYQSSPRFSIPQTAEDLSYMFANVKSITAVPIVNNVTNCSHMFENINKSVAVYGISASSKLENCSYMFANSRFNGFHEVINNIILQNNWKDCSHMFDNCLNLGFTNNSDTNRKNAYNINIGLNVINTSYMFANCCNLYNYCNSNRAIRLSPSIIDASYMFYSVGFNNSNTQTYTYIEIINGSNSSALVNASHMFDGYLINSQNKNSTYFQPFFDSTTDGFRLNMLENLKDASYMFANRGSLYSRYSSVFHFPNNIENSSHMFFNTSYPSGGTIVLPESINNCEYMFSRSIGFSPSITFPSNIESIAGVFSGTQSISSTSIIFNNSNKITNVSSLFASAIFYNNANNYTKVYFGNFNNVTDASYMFSSCVTYFHNDSMKLNLHDFRNLKNASCMFQHTGNSISTNYSVVADGYLPENLEDASSMFASTTAPTFSTFEQSNSFVNLPSGLKNMTSFFSSPWNYANSAFVTASKIDVTIPKLVTNAMQAFSQINILGGGNINIKGYADKDLTAMFYNSFVYGSGNINVYISAINNIQVTNMFGLKNNSKRLTIYVVDPQLIIEQNILGRDITYSQVGTNYRNTAFNIYINIQTEDWFRTQGFYS